MIDRIITFDEENYDKREYGANTERRWNLDMKFNDRWKVLSIYEINSQIYQGRRTEDSRILANGLSQIMRYQ